MKNIPPVDLARQYQLIQEEATAAVLQLLSSGRYIGGQVVSDFEQKFADYINVAECVSCNSGTDALYLALRCFNIGAGDEVITSSFSFFATAEVITRVGATPVFVDIDKATFNLDPAKVEDAITNKTKAIIPVHLFGQPVDMTKLMAIADKYHLLVIEDCAQATGAEWGDKKVGSIGHVGCFSFFPTKNLGACGDGGALTTNDKTVATTARMLKEHGSSVRYLHDSIGLNSRLDALQAAILQIKLQHLETWNHQRAELSRNYQNLLSPLTEVELPQEIAGGKSVWNQYTICLKKDLENSDNSRDKIRQELQKKGVTTMIYYPVPLHLQPVYQHLNSKKSQLIQAEQAAQEVLSLPMFPELSFSEQEQVAYGLKDCLLSAKEDIFFRKPSLK